ncbi:MAG: ribonucleotide-diphosphate reductase subunit beta [Proteobacteria bacterium]|nr:ribonucleotide-diphosphate reductase subunit beta [Pseudomonadota bacterium]MCH9735786.1 ribonucleotide-diphosphate reductase subunit beta [Actinomycetes bacterium]
MDKKVLYNPQGVDSLEEKLIGGNPSGLLNFNKSRYEWAGKLYKSMRDCFWTPESVNTTREKLNYLKLSDDEKFSYDRVFAQLSFLDSLIADSLADNLNGYITNKVVNACIIEQSAQEVLHSKSYAVLLADTVENSNEVFELYKSDLTLNAKNSEVHKMFAELTDGEVTREKIFYALVANQLLEGIFFQTGFATIYYLGDRMVGSADMVKEIHKDELHHLKLFENIIKEFIKENDDLAWFMIRAKVNAMFDKAYELESSWMHYILGHAFSKQITDSTVAYFIKKRQQAIGMYDEHNDKYGFGEKTILVNALNQREMANETRTNFFEGKVSNYSKQELNFDDADDEVINPEVGTTWRLKQPSYQEAIREKSTVIDVEDRSGDCIGCQ